MSDFGRTQRPGDPKSAGASEVENEPRLAPRERGLFGAARMEAVRAEREDVAASLRNRLAVMRKGDGGKSKPAAIPEGGGAPLPGGVKAQMEPRLGADLSDVRVHAGGESAEAASALGARAFTVGSDVHFGRGELAPGTKEGDKLIAHELTHVVQGQRSGIQRKPTEDGAAGGGGGIDPAGGHDAARGHEVSDPADPAEKEADAKADEVAGSIHSEKGRKGKSGGADEHAAGAGNEKAGRDADHGHQGGHGHVGGGDANATAGAANAAGHAAGAAVASEKPAPIAAKLSGVGRKIFRASTVPPTGAGPPSTPTTGTSSATATSADPELKLPELQQQLVDVLAPKNGYSAVEVAPLAKKLAPAGKLKKSEFDAKKGGNLESELLLEWRIATGDEAFAKAYSKPDPIAARNLAQVDGANAAHFEGGGSAFAQHKKGFYDSVSNELLTAPKRETCFNKAFFPGSVPYRFKGKKLTDKLPQFMQRTMGYTDFRDRNVDAAELGRQASAWYNGRTGKKADLPTFEALPDAQKLKEDYLRQAGGDEAAIRKLVKGTFTFRANWWSPNSLNIKPGEAGFAQLMSIFALEPQWFADGTVFMSCDMKAVERPELLEARKPTCFDGMQSAMWVPREDGGEVYGVTGGGIQEALCQGIDAKSVTKYQCNFPSPDVSAAIKTFDTQIQAKTGGSAANALERAQSNPAATAKIAQGMQNAGPGGGAAAGLQMGVSNQTEAERKKPTTTAQAQKNSTVQDAGTPKPRTV